MEPLKIERNNTISDSIRKRLADIDQALIDGYKLKQVYKSLIDAEEIDCSYSVFGNTYRRIKGVRRLKKKTEKIDQSLATTEKEKNDDSEPKPIKKAQFVRKKDIKLDEFED